MTISNVFGPILWLGALERLSPIWVNRDVSTVGQPLPVLPGKQTC
jgi:hypothetical protein